MLPGLFVDADANAGPEEDMPLSNHCSQLCFLMFKMIYSPGSVIGPGSFFPGSLMTCSSREREIGRENERENENEN